MELFAKISFALSMKSTYSLRDIFFPRNTCKKEIGLFLTLLVAMHGSELFPLLPLIPGEQEKIYFYYQSEVVAAMLS